MTSDETACAVCVFGPRATRVGERGDNHRTYRRIKLARLSPQTAPSLVERIVREIKSSIVAGDLRPGEQFSIGELSAEMDVSHIPVREALRRLEADGLVMLRPGRRAIVTPLSLEELMEVYRLRMLIEADLAGRSARHYTDEQLQRAARACERLGVPDPKAGT